MKVIDGGVCAAQGFKAGSCHCGIRKNQTKDDLAIIYSTQPCRSAAVYTKNIVKAAPLKVTKAHLENGIAQAVIVNSGNANACNEVEMEKTELGFQTEIELQEADTFNFCLCNEKGEWDNNNGLNYIFK